MNNDSQSKHQQFKEVQKLIQKTSGFWFCIQGAQKLPLYPSNKKKAKQSEKSTTLLGSIRKSRTQGKLLPP